MISQFSIDWVSRNWYFMDVLNNFMFLCSSDMKFCRIIIKTTQSDVESDTEREKTKLRTFAIDPNAGYLFITKHNPLKRVGAAVLRYSMDGKGMLSIIQKKLFYPNDITLDVAMKKIYFLDHYFDYIQQCDYDGSNRRFLQKLPPMKINRIAFFENMFYSAVYNNVSIIKISKTSSIIKKVLAENLEALPKIVKVFHQQTQPVKTKICGKNNKCEHLCVPSLEMNEGSTARVAEKCLCHEGYKLENGKCLLRQSTKFLMFVQDYPKMLKGVDINGTDDNIIAPIIGLKSNIAFDVDLNNKVVFFSSYSDLNSSENSIIEFRLFNGSNRGMLKGSFGPIQSMSYDWVGKNLFFTSKTPKSKIASVRLKTNADSQEMSMMKTLISKNLNCPCSLALDPENGKKK